MTITFSDPVRIGMVAGEPSGDLLAASLLKGLKGCLPKQTLYEGIGGKRMIAEGFVTHWPLEKLAVRGYVEALKHIPSILNIRRQLRQKWLRTPPDVFIGVDAPDFNFALEMALKKNNIPTVHFVCPSIWAWRGGRIKTIQKAVAHMLCVFPFEIELMQQAGVSASYVGHPLADEIPLHPNMQKARDIWGFSSSDSVIAVLPGSRVSEIRLIAPVFFETMRLIQKCEPHIRFLLPAATPEVQKLLLPFVKAYPELSLTITEGQSQQAMTAANVVLVKSGTVTLEAALLKKPMVISYKVPWLTARIMQRQGYLPYVGLPNILAKRFVVPELLQDFATPQALTQAVLAQLYDDENRRNLVNIFTEMHLSLRQNTSLRAAEAVCDILSQYTTKMSAC